MKNRETSKTENNAVGSRELLHDRKAEYNRYDEFDASSCDGMPKSCGGAIGKSAYLRQLQNTQKSDPCRDKNGKRTIKKNEKKFSGFSRFLFIYVSVFLALIAIGLTVFWNFIDSYENSRHEHVIKEFLSDIDEEGVKALIGDDPLSEFESSSLLAEHIRKKAASDDLRCVKTSGRYTDDAPVYTVTSGGIDAFTVTLSRSQDGAGFGFDSFEVTDLAIGSSDGTRVTVTVTAPADAQITVNGKGLSSAYVEENIAYPKATVWETDDSILPRMTVYRISGLVLVPEVTALSGADGSPVITESDRSTDIFFDVESEKKHTLEVLVPEGATVTLGGVALDGEQITERGIRYESYRDDPFNLAKGEYPTIVKYTIHDLVSEPERKVMLGEWELLPESETTSDGDVCVVYLQNADSMYFAEIRVPSSSEAFVNGIKLDEKYIKESGAVYEEIAELTDYIVSPITERVYLVNMLYAEPTVEITDAGGIRTSITGENGIYRVRNSIDDSIKSDHAALVENVITRYVEYTAAGYTDTGLGYFTAIRNCTWEGSPAYVGITDSRYSFAQNIPCRIRSLTVESYDYMTWGDNCFSCTVDFTAELTNFKNVTDKVEGVTLYFANDGEEWKLIKMLLS